MSDASCDVPSAACAVALQAAGLKHIGFGPLKKENQDEFFIQVGEFGGLPGSNLFCVFDGHGTFGKDAALYSRQLLPRLLDVELRKYFQVGGPAPARTASVVMSGDSAGMPGPGPAQCSCALPMASQ